MIAPGAQSLEQLQRLVIISIDHPFTGPVHVGSGPLLQVLADFVAAE